MFLVILHANLIVVIVGALHSDHIFLLFFSFFFCLVFSQRDFLSIELVEGKVHLTFELGSGPLTLTSTKVYNTGVWYKIALQRNKRKGIVLISYIFICNPSMSIGMF